MSPKTPSSSVSPRPRGAPREQLKPARPEILKRKKRILQHRKAKNKVGRPPAITPEQVRKLEEAFQNDFTFDEAWDHADVRRSTYYDKLRDDTEFSDRMRRAQQFPLTLSKKTVFAQIKGTEEKPGDGALALRVLERRQPDRYRTKIESDAPPLPPLTLILPGMKDHPRFKPQKKK